ncbi:histone acetyltransferase MCC1-like [Salvia splendens]|uniref:histone acetyltransferase MCC1-like n=1 Tax=Salvia splendens TaxID=180675 RepID=UPI001102E6DC|nr:histone acetyltransferase MCC1-like [Salvia splendens]
MPYYSMVNIKVHRGPVIAYRPIQPSDLVILERTHGELFPIRYETEFFQNVVNGQDIVSWGAVDRSRPDEQSDELVGFVTVRIIPAKDSEIEDLLSFDASKTDQTLVYILTLGVIDSYRNLGIAGSLIHEVTKYASNLSSCRAVYLHVISYNNPAIHLYKKMSFQCVRRLYNFYYINGQHFDSYLFVYYVNGGRSPCSPLELVTLFVTYARSGFKSLAAKLWKNDERKISKWPKYKESGYLLPTVQSKRILTNESSGCQFV